MTFVQNFREHALNAIVCKKKSLLLKLILIQPGMMLLRNVISTEQSCISMWTRRRHRVINIYFKTEKNKAMEQPKSGDDINIFLGPQEMCMSNA